MNTIFEKICVSILTVIRTKSIFLLHLKTESRENSWLAFCLRHVFAHDGPEHDDHQTVFLSESVRFNQCCGSENFFFGFGSTKKFSDSDTDSADIYFGTSHSKVFFQWPTNIFWIQYYEEKFCNCENTGMCFFSFNYSICHALLLNYSVWIRIRIRIRIFIWIQIRIDSDQAKSFGSFGLGFATLRGSKTKPSWHNLKIF
jgi:hypothetical protein